MKSTNPMADRLREMLALARGHRAPRRHCYDVLSSMILESARASPPSS